MYVHVLLNKRGARRLKPHWPPPPRSHSVDPLPMAGMFLQAFHAALREGRIDREKTRRTM